jgi:hypothetical protein
VAKIGKIDQKFDFLIFFSKVLFLNVIILKRSQHWRVPQPEKRENSRKKFEKV